MFKKITVTAAALAASMSFTATPAQAGTDAYMGEIMLVPYSFCPRGTLPTDGRLLPIAQNTALFSLIGTFYGGNGRTTFALPNLDAPSSANGQELRYCIATQGIFPSRS